MLTKIALIGGMASGKTTFGKKIAAGLGLPFFDTDTWVEEQVGLSVVDIFAKQGEPIFREWETRALKVLLKQDRFVLATGGGIIKRAENRVLLKEGAFVIYLDVSIATQLERTKGDLTRPILFVADKAMQFRALYEERDPLYREIADQVIDANQRSVT